MYSIHELLMIIFILNLVKYAVDYNMKSALMQKLFRYTIVRFA
jgi:hypothetical protein